LVTYDRYPIFKDRRSRQLLKKACLVTMRNRPFHLDAICLLFEHIHFLMRLPEKDKDYSARISSTKAIFTKAFLEDNLNAGFGSDYRGKGERTVWQHRFWEHMIRDENDLIRHFDYLHFNPVKYGLVHRVKDWPWSSFHRFVRQGICPIDWGGGYSFDRSDQFGE
jgi:putative transposase